MHKVFRYSPVYLDASLKRVLQAETTTEHRGAIEAYREQLPDLWTAAQHVRLTARQAQHLNGLVIDAKIAARRGAVDDVLKQTKRVTEVLVTLSELGGGITHPPDLPTMPGKKGR